MMPCGGIKTTPYLILTLLIKYTYNLKYIYSQIEINETIKISLGVHL